MDALPLNDGLKIGETTYSRLTVSPLDAGGAIDAAIAGEKVRFGPNGEPVIVASPTVVATERLRRQVTRLESKDGQTMQGPILVSDLRRMSERDYRSLLARADQVDIAYLARECDNTAKREETGAGDNPDGTGA